MEHQRQWLYAVQSTLNDAHMIVTDAVHGSWAADETVLLERIDMAIMHCQAMRQQDRTLEPGRLHVRQTRVP